MTASNGVYVFDRHSVHPATRELRRAGKPVPAAPLVFDLLIYLIERRDRVVRKEELLEQVWRGAVVTSSALPRAVSKLRTALGEAPGRQQAIKTINRVGYRFVGVLHDDAPTAAESGSESAYPVASPIRTALLPFVNATGDSQNNWIDLGLMSLVRHALQADERLALIATSETLGVLGQLSRRASTLETTALVQRRLNAHCVVHCRVSAGKLGYRAEYTGYGPKAMGMSGALEDADLMRLGQRIAEAIETRLSAGDMRSVPFQCASAFANQALARALEAQARQLQATAALYFRVVLDLEPSNPLVRILAVRCLATYAADQAIELSEFLLAEVLHSGDTRLKAAAHEAAGSAIWHRDPEAASDHLDEAMRLAQECAPDDEMARIYASKALAATQAADEETARRLFERVELISRGTGNESRLCWVLNNLAAFDLYAGDFEAAERRVEEAIVLARRLVQPVTLCALMGTKAEIAWSQGALRKATRLCDVLALELPQCGYELTIAAECFAAARIYREVGQQPRLDELVKLVGRLTSTEDLRIQALVAATQGIYAMAGRNMADAVVLLQRAAEIGLRAKDHQQVKHFLGLLAEVWLRLGDHRQCEDVISRLSTMPMFPQDAPLQRQVDHLRAAVAHSRGEREAALDLLLGIACNSPASRVASIARLDAAWLSLEAGDQTLADGLAAQVGPWLTSHPLGIVVRARNAHESRLKSRAVETLRQCVELHDAAPVWLTELHDSFAAGTPCPALPRLPSMM